MTLDDSTLACCRCRHFHDHGTGNGDCHRYPPTFVGGDTPNERHRWRFPPVLAHNGCGEFKAEQP